ncbi:hypothetical protein DFH06DRAFT_1145447 [Mycena polygramma]|nr:hypothetical protein DFH06DRAFT_1145447 [Mycena polygramma]
MVPTVADRGLIANLFVPGNVQSAFRTFAAFVSSKIELLPPWEPEQLNSEAFLLLGVATWQHPPKKAEVGDPEKMVSQEARTLAFITWTEKPLEYFSVHTTLEMSRGNIPGHLGHVEKARIRAERKEIYAKWTTLGSRYRTNTEKEGRNRDQKSWPLAESNAREDAVWISSTDYPRFVARDRTLALIAEDYQDRNIATIVSPQKPNEKLGKASTQPLKRSDELGTTHNKSQAERIARLQAVTSPPRVHPFLWMPSTVDVPLLNANSAEGAEVPSSPGWIAVLGLTLSKFTKFIGLLGRRKSKNNEQTVEIYDNANESVTKRRHNIPMKTMATLLGIACTVNKQIRHAAPINSGVTRHDPDMGQHMSDQATPCFGVIYTELSRWIIGRDPEVLLVQEIVEHDSNDRILNLDANHDANHI